MAGIKKGAAAMPAVNESNVDWLKVKSGEQVTVAPVVGLDQLISITQHGLFRPSGSSPVFMCIGSGCPGCELHDKAKFKAFLPVKTSDGSVKIFSFGRQVALQLDEFEKEYDGGIKGKKTKIKRTGEGLNTKWSVIVTAAEVDVDGAEVPDIESALGPQTREGILELMEAKSFNFDLEKKLADSKAGEEPKSGKRDDDEWKEL